LTSFHIWGEFYKLYHAGGSMVNSAIQNLNMSELMPYICVSLWLPLLRDVKLARALSDPPSGFLGR